jgi:hypothetical protein
MTKIAPLAFVVDVVDYINLTILIDIMVALIITTILAIIVVAITVVALLAI